MQNTDNQILTSYFDELLQAVIQERRFVKVQYFTDLREFISSHSLIKKQIKIDEMDYLELANGTKIKLDFLVSISGVYAPQYAYIQDFTCDC
jgi:hypothetical protein